MPSTQGPFLPYNLPWFIFDLSNLQIMTSETIPLGDITDTKDIILSETPIPGLNFNPINAGGMGNRKISFTIPLVKRNNTVGNVLLMKQFDSLRNQSFGLSNIAGVFGRSAQFTPNPKVLYFWGTGSGVPLEYYVKKCDPVHRSSFVNSNGYTQYSEISMELWLDETSLLFRAEESFRKISSVLSTFSNAYNTIRSTDSESRS